MEPFSISAIPGDTSGVYIGMSNARIYKYKVLSGNTQGTAKSISEDYKGHNAIVNSIDHKKNVNISN